MSGRLRILRAGPGSTVQDAGRHHYLRYGVTPAGPMDWIAYRTANAVLGNPPDAAAVEIAMGGLELVCEEAPLHVAFCGAGFAWTHKGRPVPTAARLRLEPGDVLSARLGAAGVWTYLAVAGGLDTPVVMGSRATHTRSGIGGIGGRFLRDGDVLPALPCEAAADLFDAGIAAPWLAPAAGPLRVVLGPQDDYFSAEGLATFTGADFRLTPSADRMAYRLEGPRIAHARGFNIVTDGIALGAIQVSGDGNPLVMMADRGPTGGYPKIGAVIRVDLCRLAQMRPGETCRFRLVERDAARAALIAAEDEIAAAGQHLVPLLRVPTTELLLGLNLVGGVMDAMTPP